MARKLIKKNLVLSKNSIIFTSSLTNQLMVNEEKYAQLIKLVRAEAKNLKTHATNEERKRLDINKLSAESTNRCIYGQMTGFCYSKRANELILSCATRVYNAEHGIDSTNIANLNGKPKPILQTEKPRSCEYHSPIELFILINEEETLHVNNNRLIDYLQGNTKTFKPEPFNK